MSSSLTSPNAIHPEQWNIEQVTRWLGTLTPSTISKLYAAKFKENDVVGEVLLQLDPDALKEIGVASIGHRLTLLKSIYELKIRWNIEVDVDDWRPAQDGSEISSIGQRSSTFSTAASSSLVNVSGVAMMRALQERDERVRALELELARLENWLVRWTGELGSSPRVEPLEPYYPPAKAYPSLPEGIYPSDDFHYQSGLPVRATPSSAFSGPVTALPSANADHGISSAEASSPRRHRTPLSAIPAPPTPSSYSMHDRPLPHAPGNMSQMDMSPTSSATPGATPTSAHPPLSIASSAPTENYSGAYRMASPTKAVSSAAAAQGSAAVSAAAASFQMASNNGPQSRLISSGGPSSPLLATTSTSAGTFNDGKKEDKAGASADGPYKSFRVTLDDPCHKVLPAALKKYKITDDWRQYALFICYGTTERCLSYDEKPLLLFQRLKEAKQSPVFMLRHIRDVKSPIAIASAKAAARKNSASSIEIGKSAAASGSAASAVQGPGGKAGDGATRGTSSEKNQYVDSPPGQPRLTGPASQLNDSKSSRSAAPTAESFAIAIYPYVSEREDEFDVSVGDTFIVKSKAKGWWVVQRDGKADGKADVTGIVRNADGSAKNGGEIRSGWVPAGCLLETKQPLSFIVSSSSSRAISPKSPAESTFLYQQQRAPTDPSNYASAQEDEANTPRPPTLSSIIANVPIPPSLITSTSTPGILLMDYDSPETGIYLKKDVGLRVFKRYNHWSYCVEEGPGHARAWLPSWYIGKVASSRNGGGGTSVGGGSVINDSSNNNSNKSSKPGSSNGPSVNNQSSQSRMAGARSEALPLM